MRRLSLTSIPNFCHLPTSVGSGLSKCGLPTSYTAYLAMGDSFSGPRTDVPLPRRSATAPILVTPSQRQAPSITDSLVETLYQHPDARVVAFTASGSGGAAVKPIGSQASQNAEDGSLLSYSSTERTIAVGKWHLSHTIHIMHD